MPDFPELKASIGAQIASDWLPAPLKIAIDKGMEWYQPLSSLYTVYGMLSSATQIPSPTGINLTALGNTALSFLSLPSVQQHLSANLAEYSNLEEATINTYLSTAVTLVSTAAFLIPKVASYINDDNAIKEKINEINQKGKEIESTLKEKNKVTMESSSSSSQTGKRKKLLHHYSHKNSSSSSPSPSSTLSHTHSHRRRRRKKH